MSYGGKSIKNLYYALPPAAKNFIASVYGLRLRRERYNRDFVENLNFLRESQFWTNAELLEFQQKRVKQFLADVLPNTPFYRKNYSRLFDAPLSDLPILTKDILRARQEDFRHDSLAKMPHKFAHTSGTTGAALVFPLEIQHVRRETAFRALHYEWGGVSLDGREKVAFCAGHPVAFPDQKNPPFWVHDAANNWLYFSSYHLTERNLPFYVRRLEKFQPAMLGGYPSSLYLLALSYKKFGKRDLKIKSVFVSSETLLDFQRAAIETAFGAKIFNYYGTSEMCVHAAECEKGEIHLKLEHSAVEILNDKNQPSASGETGRIVTTSFNNRAFPLVRYDLGDTVKISVNQQSKCGRGGLILDEITGRIEDYIVTPDKRIVGRLDHLFKNSRRVREAQIYQESPAEIVLRIVKTDDFDGGDEREILAEARGRLGSEIKIRFEYVAQIERTAGGKFRFVVSNVNQAEILRSLAN